MYTVISNRFNNKGEKFNSIHDFKKRVEAEGIYLTMKADKNPFIMILEIIEIFQRSEGKTTWKAKVVDEPILSLDLPEVGQGVSVKYYSDVNAFTIIEVKGRSITIQRAKATLKKPCEFIEGGFLGVAVGKQEYEFIENEKGTIYKARLCKDGNYHIGGVKGEKVSLDGYYEYYDYGF